MKTHRIHCFGRTDESGNAAIVVEGSTLTQSQRQAFAHEQDASATVFVDFDASGDVQLDYYYPHARSPLCLHATLAASAVCFERDPRAGSIRFITSVHRQALEVERVEETIFIGVSPQPCPAMTADLAETAALLRVAETDLAGIRGPASVGSPKLLVEVADRSLLDSMRPNLAGIAEWSRKHGISGIYVYCRLRDGVYAGRNFNHLEPRLEDAATGVAAGALALVLRQSVTLLQGDGLGQPCTLVARYLNGAVQVGGRAVRVTAARSFNG
ncbi:PhzF family phenazine biosynthesis protein [Trinickia dabaoshanensis]|uniref:PhzF family phenazine biosynthesis protein n=1 Tax=Trinickia dabaoshanensis TaxID=564714 RepID=A0A2N7VCW6_9BURK|nr:PhzF family phenazine biosynthesis protein [Trinickia dabaoshanensis]PMS15008.1 PhzF family phenazine biosynthesis protein [Trinickia dabaoshanensis]